jgi:hypothetical protein
MLEDEEPTDHKADAGGAGNGPKVLGAPAQPQIPMPSSRRGS